MGIPGRLYPGDRGGGQLSGVLGQRQDRLFGGWGSLMLEGWIIEGRARLVCNTHARVRKVGLVEVGSL